MREVNVNVSELRQVVGTNRAKHREEVKAMKEGYRAAVGRWFAEQAAALTDGGEFQVYCTLPVPEDHGDDYDMVLDMLTMTADDTVVLSQQEFRQYVRDDWAWKGGHLANATHYLGDPSR